MAIAVVVEATDDAALTFYEHFGFVCYENHPYRLYLPMTTIGSLLP